MCAIEIQLPSAHYDPESLIYLGAGLETVKQDPDQTTPISPAYDHVLQADSRLDRDNA
jgi:hypothetical protein